MFAFFGFRDKHDEVMKEQRSRWSDLIEHAFIGDQSLADKYRQEFYRKTVTSPYSLLSEFEKFIVAHPRIREEYFDAELKSSGGCDICNGCGYVDQVPVFRRQQRVMMRLDRKKHDRVRQMIYRRAMKLAWDLAKFGHADFYSGVLSSDAIDVLEEFASQDRFVKDYREIMGRLGGRYTARRCTCLKSIEYGDLEPIESEVYTYLSQDKAQQKRQFYAMCEYYDIPTRYITLKEMTERIKPAMKLMETDARFVDGYYGDYDRKGEVFNSLRKIGGTERKPIKAIVNNQDTGMIYQPVTQETQKGH